MLRRFAIVGVIAVLLSSLGTMPAQAAQSKRLKLASSSVTVAAPVSPADACDYVQINCGAVAITTTFSGLTGRSRPTEPGVNGALSGTAHIVRSYGCESGEGRRLHRYDRRSDETAVVNMRRGTGFHIPAQGDKMTVITYAFLTDLQPGNCPAGTTPMTYSIKADHVRLQLVSTWASVPSADYSVRGRAEWRGAVPTPTRVSAGQTS